MTSTARFALPLPELSDREHPPRALASKSMVGAVRAGYCLQMSELDVDDAVGTGQFGFDGQWCGHFSLPRGVNVDLGRRDRGVNKTR